MRRVLFARPWIQVSKPALTGSSLAAKKGAAAVHLVIFSTKRPSPPPSPKFEKCIYFRDERKSTTRWTLRYVRGLGRQNG